MLVRNTNILISGASVAGPALAYWLRENGFTRTLVVADAFNAARVDQLALQGSVTVFAEIQPDPDIPNLEKLLAVDREIAKRGGGRGGVVGHRDRNIEVKL